MGDKFTGLIAGGESETVEFKTAFNKDVIETAVAFANRQGHFAKGLDGGGN